jgi:diguanylate cyclase (GGDEF)-like protein/PAS domain S-box-containing protein
MSWRHPLILIADDDPGARLLHRIALEGGGFTVETVADGIEALAAFERLQPDCLVLDVVMPGFTGFEVCRQVRAHPQGKHIPILILTSLDDLDSISTAYVAGATDFAQKGINPLLLVERVRFMLRAAELQSGLIASESRLAQAQRMARIGHWEYDADGRTVAISLVALDILGLTSAEALHIEALRQCIHPDDLDRVQQARQNMQTNTRTSIDYRIVTPLGVERVVHMEGGSQQQHTDGHRDNRVVTLQDITELRRAEQHIRMLAYFDSLTGLPNRAFLQEQLSLKLKIAASARTQVAVIALDVEHLNRVNQSLGTAAGDALLRAVAQRLNDHFSANDASINITSSVTVANSPVTIARTSGDEFGIAITMNANVGRIATVLQQLTQKMNAPFHIAGQEIAIGTTVGATVFPDDGDDADELLRRTDAALHQAKKTARGSYQFYSAKMQEHASRRMSLESDLRRALQREQLQLHYQPRVSAKTLQPVGIEALLRWQHPDRGMISPAEFVPIAEDLGLILELGEWVLDQACGFAARMARTDQALRVAVNVSAIQLQRAAIAEQVSQALSTYQLDPGLLEIEITEGILIDKPELVRRTLETLKQQNIRIALDDFGTGYSSLSYLRTLPIDYLKIDRSFVADLQNGSNSAAIIATILTLARGLDLHTIAEGIETQDQAKQLIKGGCDELQGFLFARPMPAEDLLGWLDAHGRRLSRKQVATRI